jgi:hypothetical protein
MRDACIGAIWVPFQEVQQGFRAIWQSFRKTKQRVRVVEQGFEAHLKGEVKRHRRGELVIVNQKRNLVVNCSHEQTRHEFDPELQPP